MSQSTMSRRSFLAFAAAAAGTLALAAVGCSSDPKPAEEKKADRAEAAIDWKYITADDLVAKLDAGEPVIVLDTRPDDMYNAGHIKGAFHVAVFPLDTEEAENTLKAEVKNLQGDAPIVVVCKTGNKGAKRAVSLLQDEGIAAERLLILEGGGEGWKSEAWTTTENDSTVPGSSK